MISEANHVLNVPESIQRTTISAFNITGVLTTPVPVVIKFEPIVAVEASILKTVLLNVVALAICVKELSTNPFAIIFPSKVNAIFIPVVIAAD